MKRRVTAGKARRRKTPNLKHRRTAAVARSRASDDANLKEQIDRQTRELAEAQKLLAEALEQQRASAEVLNVISNSGSETDPVFEKIVESCERIFATSRIGLNLIGPDGLVHAGAYGKFPGAEKLRRENFPHPVPGSATGAVISAARPIQYPDALRGPDVPQYGRRAAEIVGFRAFLMAPLLSKGRGVGAIFVGRETVGSFSDKEIALLKTFAAQAVIAIENTRLLNELRQSLEQQTATSEVLRVISSSPGELEPVFQAMLENATRICEATFGSMLLREGDVYRRVAVHNAPPKFEEFSNRAPILRRGTARSVDQVTDTRQVSHILDVATEDPSEPIAKFGGARTLLVVPMLKENETIGVLGIYRQEVRPFTDKQIALVQNFAAQAVIAIENTRLLNELRQSLEQQTGTAKVLGVISSSPGELQPVYDAMLQNAVRLCDARFGNIYRCDGDTLNLVATHNTPPALFEARRSAPLLPDPETPTGRIVTTKALVHIPDLAAEQAYAERNPAVIEAVELGGIRTLLLVPMLKDDELVGVLTIYRQEVRPFTDKQIALMRSFASQAVIAIENARLLNDLNKLNQHLEQRVADQVGEIERMGRLRRFLPPQVADLIVASGTEKQLESHRREITALFCDLRGFTGFSESSDPEDVMTLLGEYHAAIGKIIFKYSGTLERYAGDGVMVIFNDPVPVENPALQAVLMALEMRTAIEALMQKWRLLGHDIGFGIGIAHGFATLGTIGFEGRRDYAAIGTVSNVASRLCDEAKPGQILISPRVLLAVDKAVTVESVGEFALKGIRRPMLAYNVLEASLSKLN